MRKLVFLIFIIIPVMAFPQENIFVETVEEFEKITWKVYPEFCSGDTEGSTFTQSDEHWKGNYSLKIDYKFNSPQEDNLTFCKEVSLDLTRFDNFELWVKGDNKPLFLYVYFIDTSGNYIFYGPGTGTNENLKLKSSFWTKINIDFNKDLQRGKKGNFDRSKVGILAVRLSDKERKDIQKLGTIYLGRMRLISKSEGIYSISSFSPNDDGVNDKITFTFYLPEPASSSVIIYNEENNKVKTFLENVNLLPGKHKIVWDGINDEKKKVVTGNYTLKIVGVTEKATIFSYSKTIKVDLEKKYPSFSYRLFLFPKGLYYKEKRSLINSKLANKYYEEVIISLKKYPINSLIAEGVEQENFKTFLQVAKKHNLKVILYSPKIQEILEKKNLDEDYILSRIKEIHTLEKEDSFLGYFLKINSLDYKDTLILLKSIFEQIDQKHFLFFYINNPYLLSSIYPELKPCFIISEISSERIFQYSPFLKVFSNKETPELIYQVKLSLATGTKGIFFHHPSHNLLNKIDEKLTYILPSLDIKENFVNVKENVFLKCFEDKEKRKYISLLNNNLSNSLNVQISISRQKIVNIKEINDLLTEKKIHFRKKRKFTTFDIELTAGELKFLQIIP